MRKAKKKTKAKPKRKAATKARRKVAKKAKKKAPAKVRCAGKTNDGKRCKRKVTKPAKYCYLHKGRR